ncbi:MAG TPA: recombinase family protein [Solirubrobacteraceae bacterium]|nr:recombinase family protein [Solirubrobacteraceae bacterium]
MPKPERFDGYIRVSRRMGRKGPGYISPTVQKEAIARWAEYRGVEIAAWHVDEDESGGTQDRPGLREAIQRIESGETEGIACWRLNRFARNVAGAIEDVKRIQSLGGHLAFVEEDIDPTGPFGSFILTVLLAVATLERDNMVAGWQTAKRHAIERGAKISPTPYGYRRRDDGTLEPHGEQAPHVVEAYRTAAVQDVSAACIYLVENAPGRTWTTATVRRMLASRTYLGESRNGSAVNAEAHEALVSRSEWEAAQREPRRRRAAATFPLSGLARCGTCGSPLVGSRGGPMIRTYRCAATQSRHKGERCPRAAFVNAEPLEHHVREQLRTLLSQLDVEIGEETSDELRTLEQAVLDAESELDAFAADITLRRALGDRYHSHLETRIQALERAKSHYKDFAREVQVRERISAADLLNSDDPLILPELLSGILASIEVQPGRGNLASRVTLIPVDDDAPARISAAHDA